ncbi:hypothetical protein [Amycolatopsis sp. NPDC021455]|uniref:hypothetical protein n=1 Tax=Amycolatopsis sp. NPDC021455 TaxID=3154901 RepID=UPI0033EF77A3
MDINEQLLSAMDEGDSKAATLPDGVRLGKFTKTRGRTTPTVTNERALLDWVAEHCPEEIEQRIRPAFLDKIFDSVKRHGAAIDFATAEVIPGIEARYGNPYISFRGEPGYQAVVAERWHEIAGPRLLDGDA